MPINPTLPPNAVASTADHTCTVCHNQRAPDDMHSCGACFYSACCPCWTCNSCNASFDAATNPTCNNCGTCRNCCRCTECPRCNTRVSGNQFHTECNECRSCCGCREGEFVRFIRAPREPSFHTAKRSQLAANPSKRYISVEIEVASCKKGIRSDTVSGVVRQWGGAIVSDGSLPDGGFEINTAPASGDLFVNQIGQICESLSTQGAGVTSACGLHVHVDARDFNFYDIRKLAFLYAKVEDALFGIVAPSRRQSTYCHPCGDKFVKDLERNILPKDSHKKIVENIYGSNVDLKRVKGDKYNTARYAAMNVHSWVYRGTIENRMHHGTVRYDKIVPWAMLWASVLDYAYSHNERDIKALKGDALSVLLTVAPNDSVREWVIARYKYFKDRTGIGGDSEDLVDRPSNRRQ